MFLKKLGHVQPELNEPLFVKQTSIFVLLPVLRSRHMSLIKVFEIVREF